METKGTTPRLPLLAERLFDTPLLVHERKLRTVVSAMAPHLGLSDFLSAEIKAAASDTFLSFHDDPVDPKGYSIRVIPVHGTLVHRGAGLMAFSGLTSYEALREELREALNDSSISAILLDIDSGGGECAGLFDFVDEIVAADEIKPIYAFAHEHAYSAAYAIASAARKIYMPRTGGVGSIGVVSVHMDQSGWDKQIGVAYTPIYAGARKIDGWPHAALSPEAKDEFQKSVNYIYEIFTQTVSKNRGLSVDNVIDTQAGCFDADEAIAIGLADGIATFDDVLEIIVDDLDSSSAQVSGRGDREGLSGSSGENSQKGDANMKGRLQKLVNRRKDQRAESDGDDKEKVEAPEEDENLEKDDETTKSEGGEDAPDDEEKAEDPEDQEDGEEDDPENDAKSARKDAAEIVELCVLSGKASLAAGFIRKGLSSDDVRKRLISDQNLKANAESGKKTIQTAHASRGDHKPGRLADLVKQRHSKE
ncbi:MAG: S49 family peptidase [Micavibrio sp.]